MEFRPESNRGPVDNPNLLSPVLFSYMYIYVYMYIYIYKYIYIYICIYIYIYMHRCICTFMYIYMHIYVCIHIYICIYTYTYIDMYIIHMHIHLIIRNIMSRLAMSSFLISDDLKKFLPPLLIVSKMRVKSC